MASQTDLAPTLLEMLGLPPLQRAEGHSLAPVLSDPDAPSAANQFIEFNGQVCGAVRMRAVVSDRCKYVYHPGDRDQLFDLQADPYELHNLIDEPE